MTATASIRGRCLPIHAQASLRPGCHSGEEGAFMARNVRQAQDCEGQQ